MSGSSGESRPAVLVIGSANADLVVRAGRIPRPGETVLGGDVATHAGGKGANQAVAAARLGATVRFVGRVGDDSFGEFLTRSLSDDGVDVTQLRSTPKCATGVALIVVDDAGQNAICVSPGANARVTPSDIDAADAAFDDVALCLLQLEIPIETVLHAVARCRSRGIRVVLNPAPVPASSMAAICGVDVLTPNASEAAALCGAEVPATPNDAKELALRLTDRAGAVIITLGDQGVVVADQQGCEHLPAHAVAVVDSTGAGDAFCGALGAALAAGRPLREAVRFANAAAALACTKPGAQSSMPTSASVERLLFGSR